MTLQEMSKFTYEELSLFSYSDLTLGKLELFQKANSDNDIPDEIKKKLGDLCYETIKLIDPKILKEKNFSKERRIETIKEVTIFLSFIETLVKAKELAEPVLKIFLDQIKLLLKM